MTGVTSTYVENHLEIESIENIASLGQDELSIRNSCKFFRYCKFRVGEEGRLQLGWGYVSIFKTPAPGIASFFNALRA